MNIHSVKFISSSKKFSKIPLFNLAEYAFSGRSNVGKSSLINMILNRKNLARTSSYTGKTRLINHYLVDKKWILADLPGYGYSKVSKKERFNFHQSIFDYILKRRTLLCLFNLIDNRFPPKNIDISFMRWLGQKQIPFCLVFTKTDKVNKDLCQKNIERYKRILINEWKISPILFKTSSRTKQGREDILKYIYHTNINICNLSKF